MIEVDLLDIRSNSYAVLILIAPFTVLAEIREEAFGFVDIDIEALPFTVP